MTDFIDRDLAANPITAQEAIDLYRAEMFELSLAKPEVISEASRMLEAAGDYADADDIHARYDAEVEEVRIMVREALAEFC